jgi:tetratricopeptide (TPR) repeat protein
MTRSLRHGIFIGLALIEGAGIALGAGGSRVEPPPAAGVAETPEQQAAAHYNEGLSYRDQAWKLQDKIAATPDPAKRAKLEEKTKRAHESSIRSFRAAIEKNPRMHQAHSSLGYAYRQTGDYAAALEAYDAALRLEPTYMEAVEYRGEAYLGLNRIEDAQAAYAELERNSRDLAAELLGAMRAWVEQRRREPAGTKVGALDAFERWIEDRAAGQAPVAESSQHKARRW